MRNVEFTSQGQRCAAWHLSGAESAHDVDKRRPCVVMAHGLGGTRDSGLLPFAEAFAGAGIDVLVFDYRGFGDSAGTPRQLVSFRRHRQDFAAAIAFARTLDGVDPERIVIWGTSYGGGHALSVAASDKRIAAVVAQVAAVDGAATLRSAIHANGLGFMLRANIAGLRDLTRALTRRPPLLVPIVGPPGSLAAMNSADAVSGMRAFAGATWRNEFAARELLAIAFNRPIATARRLHCPVLLQIGEKDSVAPPATIERLARRIGGAEIRRYPVGHFDVYVEPWRTHNINDQVAFLRKHLTQTTVDSVETS
ncbi:alpha/beta hydrolase [Rhodococcus sp. NCIMB 12038]|jgi:pimeloyl-ACP methyl ester carboxylesterase|uniref:alpha/beta hydrolase n=1 Tax=Rhodococcus sp. NCIMB 12038 TaxID=933800 RepID=UPI000B3CCA59|nr:alpha/beta fold hydrolase [Rhodococcus sp. NCIMB 12038]OUS88561.1 alpha/beta hydrolase [Rhodococcus sp. NCIMB 12038]